jgi:hypothetical protein
MVDLYGINRSQAYVLAAQGKIRTVCLRKPGAIKGKRLFDCESVRKFLMKNYDEALKAPVARKPPSVELVEDAR